VYVRHVAIGVDDERLASCSGERAGESERRSRLAAPSFASGDSEHGGAGRSF
jgi:hypothetical protein